MGEGDGVCGGGGHNQQLKPLVVGESGNESRRRVESVSPSSDESVRDGARRRAENGPAADC